MSYSSEVLADSPLLYVRFEETAGATCANDGSLAGNATAAGTYTRNISTGMTGLSVGIDLDGTSGVVTYPDTASLDITGDVTYECWINADALQSTTLISKGGNASTIGGYELQSRGGGNFRVLRAGLTVLLTGAAGGYTAGSWVHVAFTRSGNNYVLFVNGASQTTATSSQTIDATSESLAIGHQRFSGAASAWFNGKIDEVAVYSTALSSARIAAHYAARNTGGAGAGAFTPLIAIVA